MVTKSYVFLAVAFAFTVQVADQLIWGSEEGNTKTINADLILKVPKVCEAKKIKWAKIKNWIDKQGDDWLPKLGDDEHGSLVRCQWLNSCNMKCKLECDSDTHSFIKGKARSLEFKFAPKVGWKLSPAKAPHSYCEEKSTSDLDVDTEKETEKSSAKKSTTKKSTATSEQLTDEPSNKEETASATHMKWVPEVKQNFEEDTLDKLNQLVSKLFHTSYTYLGMASFYGRADVALPGFQKLMTDLWAAEQAHTRDVINYINTRGGYVKLHDIHRTDSLDQLMNRLMDSSVSHRTGEKGLQIALETTKEVNEMLLSTIEAAVNAKPNSDPHVKHFLEHDMLISKTEMIKKLTDMLARLDAFQSPEDYAVGEYVLDTEELL